MIPKSSSFARGFAALASVLAFAFPLFAAAPPRRVATPQVSVEHGLQERPIEVTLFTTTRGASIRYTTDGSVPTATHGSLYDRPLAFGTTTVLRAAAFRDGLADSPVRTKTYLFPSEVPHQTGAGFPATWGIREGKPVIADYAMDPEVVGNPAYRESMIPGLRSLPSLSIVMPVEDLFGAERGIYAHPMETGSDWERAASIELLIATTTTTDASGVNEGANAGASANASAGAATGFQIDAGIRIQGGWNRRPEESPKHAFRLSFRKKYGAGKLKFPLFGPDQPREFDDVILRAGCNNTWLHWSGEERRHGDFLRDQWMRDTYAAMGHASARGRFVHLYLNGLYWGLYNLTERPSAPFAASRFGGDPDDYDVRNADNLLAGDDTAWKQLGALLERDASQPPAWTDVERLLDLPAFADYLLLNHYGANGDWDAGSNWYAARRRQPPGPFHFFVWDGERTLENATDNTLAYDAADSPPHLFQRLRSRPDFRQLFADRAKRHLTGEGVLTPAGAAARYRTLAATIENAVIAESARWGDYRRDVHVYKTGPYELYTRDDHWRPEVRRLLEDYFPRRAAEYARQLEAAGLWTPTPR